RRGGGRWSAIRRDGTPWSPTACSRAPAGPLRRPAGDRRAVNRSSDLLTPVGLVGTRTGMAAPSPHDGGSAGHHAPDARQLTGWCPARRRWLCGRGARRAPLAWGDLMSQLVVTSYGDPRESVSLERAPGLLLGTDDILVEMEAAPVNNSDFLLVRGDYGV